MTVARDFLFVACEAGHDWQSIGGANAGCAPDCVCSVPVNTCSRCGDSDYGDNNEGRSIRAECKQLLCECCEKLKAECWMNSGEWLCPECASQYVESSLTDQQSRPEEK